MSIFASLPSWVVPIGSLTISAISAFFAIRASRNAAAMRTKQLALQLEADRLSWGKDALAALGDAHRFLETCEAGKAVDPSEQMQIAYALSILVDQGRLNFPNIEHNKHGANKERAYQGKRPPILDFVMYGFYQIHEMPHTPSAEFLQAACEYMRQIRRNVTSEIRIYQTQHRVDDMFERYRRKNDDDLKRSKHNAAMMREQINARLDGLLDTYQDQGWREVLSPDEIAEVRALFTPPPLPPKESS